MERRSPTGIDRREAVETPQRPPEHKRGNGAPVSDRHRPPRGGRNPPNPPEHKRGNGAPVSDRHRRPASTAAISFPAVLTHRGGGRNPPARQSTSAEMERRSPTGIAAREGRETALSPKAGKGGQTLRVRCHQFPRGADAPQRRRSPAAKSAEMERRSPTGIDRREAVETPQTRQSTSAEMERRSPTGIAAREGRETTLSQKAGTKPSGFAAISFPAVLTHRSGGDPQQRKARKWSAGLRPASTAERRSKPPKPARAQARKWSAGLRPASRPERAAKPRYPKRQAPNPPGSLPSVSPRC